MDHRRTPAGHGSVRGTVAPPTSTDITGPNREVRPRGFSRCVSRRGQSLRTMLLDMGKIGLGLITCNAADKFESAVASIPPGLDEVVIVNDGAPYDSRLYPPRARVIQHEQNRGVAVTKNDALRHLLDRNCEHLFLMEDDVIIEDPRVFQRYIDAARLSGIWHLNYALQGPHNREQSPELVFEPPSRLRTVAAAASGGLVVARMRKALSLEERGLLREDTPPAPKCVKEYPGGVALAFYEHCVGAFSYYHRRALDAVGLLDENYYNAWEHVEHTFRLAKAGLTSPFWWFADLADSAKYLSDIPNCMARSTIANAPGGLSNIERGEAHFRSKTGYGFGAIPRVPARTVPGRLDAIRIRNAGRLLIKFPTRSRRGRFFEVLDLYQSKLERPDLTHFLISCDADDTSMNAPMVREHLARYPNVSVHYGDNRSKIQAVNASMKEAPDFDILLLASDDMIPVAHHYDAVVRREMAEHFPDTDGVLWFNDGYRGRELNTLCILGKRYYDRFGYIYHPAYKSLWCDNEFMLVAKKLRRQIYFGRVLIKHAHPQIPGAAESGDALLELNNSFDAADKATFLERRARGFDLKQNVLRDLVRPVLAKLTR
jgi:GT2 family glycosyltransferase